MGGTGRVGGVEKSGGAGASRRGSAVGASARAIKSASGCDGDGTVSCDGPASPTGESYSG
jgi:hypothetical protein